MEERLTMEKMERRRRTLVAAVAVASAAALAAQRRALGSALPSLGLRQ